jgi:hypothetical protein
MEKLLVCIACHHSKEREANLYHILSTLWEYDMEVRVIIDTQERFEVITNLDLEVHVHAPAHPYHLTWYHRAHFLRELENYDYFMYIEDDMEIPFENFKNYLKNFKLLWPSFVPSFVRLETFEREKYIVDAVNRNFKRYEIEGREFIGLSNPYHAFWIMPQKELKETLRPDFARLDTWRELAASYPMWELKKTPLVEITNGQIEPLCYSYHLTNNYAPDLNTPFGKIKITDLCK